MNSPRVIPKTTAGMIGWRSTNTVYQLEKYGPYTKGKFNYNKKLVKLIFNWRFNLGKQSITKSLKWPKEGCI